MWTRHGLLRWMMVVLMLTGSLGALTPAPVAAILSSPTLLTPTDAAAVTSFTPVFDWTDVEGAASYEIQVSESPGFSGNLVGGNHTLHGGVGQGNLKSPP